MRKDVKLNARIDLRIPLSIITPKSMSSEEATVEISDDQPDLVDIHFSTAMGKIGLLISPGDLEKVLQATKHES